MRGHKHRYTEQQIDYLRSVAKGRGYAEITDMFNREFDLDLNLDSVSGAMKRNGIYTGTNRNNGGEIGIPPRRYTAEQIEFVKSISAGKRRSEILELFNARYNMNLSLDNLGTLMHNHEIHNGLAGKFPRNAEQRAKVTETLNRIRLCYPVGAEVINVNGFIFVKIDDPSTWRLKHIMVWEQKYGPVPKDHVLTFGDGNKLNTDISNLVLVHRRQFGVMSARGIRGYDVDSTKACINIASLYVAINDCKKERCKNG